jgi:hypothetical protein
MPSIKLLGQGSLHEKEKAAEGKEMGHGSFGRISTRLHGARKKARLG